MKKILLLLLLLLLSLSVVAAQDEAPPARLRFAHLSADYPNADISVADEVVAADVAFGTVTNYLTFPEGIYPILVAPTDGSIEFIFGPYDVELLSGHDYIYGVMGLTTENTFERLLIDETLLHTDTDPNMAHVLFIHAMSGVFPVDARVEGSDQRFADGLEFGGYEFNSVAPGEYPIVVSLVSDTSEILLDQLNPVTLYPDQLMLVAAVNSPDGGVDIVVKITGMLTITELIANGDSFNTLRALIEAAGLTETLANRAAEPVTVFAPTDEAFSTAFDALGLEPGALLDAPDFLDAILNYHIAAGIWAAEDLAAASSIATRSGAEIQLSLDGETILLNGGARISEGDLLASNGVIHVIDALLIPPAQ